MAGDNARPSRTRRYIYGGLLAAVAVGVALAVVFVLGSGSQKHNKAKTATSLSLSPLDDSTPYVKVAGEVLGAEPTMQVLEEPEPAVTLRGGLTQDEIQADESEAATPSPDAVDELTTYDAPTLEIEEPALDAPHAAAATEEAGEAGGDLEGDLPDGTLATVLGHLADLDAKAETQESVEPWIDERGKPTDEDAAPEETEAPAGSEPGGLPFDDASTYGLEEPTLDEQDESVNEDAHGPVVDNTEAPDAVQGSEVSVVASMPSSVTLTQ